MDLDHTEREKLADSMIAAFKNASEKPTSKIDALKPYVTARVWVQLNCEGEQEHEHEHDVTYILCL